MTTTTRAENVREARRATRFFARALKPHYEFAAAQSGDVVFVVARGEYAKRLRRSVHRWGGAVERVP